MNQIELHNHLDSIGLPLAYDHFTEYQNPPYIIYKFSYASDLMADDTNYKEISNFQIELYTSKKDLNSEKLVEDKLKEIEQPYSKSEEWIESEEVFQIVYNTQII